MKLLGDATVALSSIHRTFPTQKAPCVSLTQGSLLAVGDIHIMKGRCVGMRHTEGTTALSHHLMCILWRHLFEETVIWEHLLFKMFLFYFCPTLTFSSVLFSWISTVKCNYAIIQLRPYFWIRTLRISREGSLHTLIPW